VKGYGDTHARGLANYRAIEARVIRPALAGEIPPARAVDSIANARTAALVDPEGESLTKRLADIDGPAVRSGAEEESSAQHWVGSASNPLAPLYFRHTP